MCDLKHGTDEVSDKEHGREGSVPGVEDVDDREKDGRPRDDQEDQ